MLKSKVILITGASHGIGRETAKLLAANHATVILLSRCTKSLNSLYDEIVQKHSPEPAIYPFNLCGASLTDFEDLRLNIEREFGVVHGLIHNAGVLGDLAPISTYNVQHWYQVLQLNLNARFLLTQSCWSLLCKAERAKVVFATNAECNKAKAYWGAYSIADSANVRLCEILQLESENTNNIQFHHLAIDKTATKLRHQAYPAEDVSALKQPIVAAQQYLDIMLELIKHEEATA